MASLRSTNILRGPTRNTVHYESLGNFIDDVTNSIEEIRLVCNYFDSENRVLQLKSNSLTSLLDLFNKRIEDDNIRVIGLLQIIFPRGQSWVVDKENRSLIGPGCAYSNAPYTLIIGREETKIQSIRIVGYGQGASVIRGSCIFNIWNLQEIGLINSLNMEENGGADQFDLRILLQNFLWVGWFAVNFKYSEEIPNMISPNVTGEDILLPHLNKYVESSEGSVSTEDLMKWRSDKKIEVLMMNVWVQLSEPPLTKIGETFSPVITSQLKVPLFFINTPSLYRIFISDCNFISYINPISPKEGEMPPALAVLSAHFLNTDGVTDLFLQNCSFSSREFGAPSPEFRSLQIVGNDKVSMLHSSFSGKVECQSNKIAAFGCYFLGTGIFPGEEETTHALEQIPPDWYYDSSAKKFGLPSGPRLIINTCQFVTHSKNIYTYSTIQDNLLRLPFCYSKWSDPQVIETLSMLNHSTFNLIFNNVTFYMVAANDINDYSKGFKFQALELTNLPPVQQIVTTSNDFTL